MKDILHFVIASIVDSKDEIVIDEHQEEGIFYYTVSVAKDEVGKIIGKEGKVIRAIRNVMKIPAIKQNKRIRIGLSESL